MSLTNTGRANYGKLAVKAGNPDHEGRPVEVIDTLTNIMHYCDRESIDFANVLQAAEMHFEAEKENEP
jgi:hypothetical protein